MSRLVSYLIVLSLVLYAILAIGFTFYQSLYQAPKDSPRGLYQLEVKKGDTIASISKQLVRDKVIGSKQALTYHVRLNKKPVTLQVGTYVLDLPAKPEDILEQINQQSLDKIRQREELSKIPVVNITFREGITLDNYIDLLVDKQVASLLDLKNYASNPGNFDRAKYIFLPKALNCEYGQSNCAKYYLEGYLYPDTYKFLQPSEPKEIFEKMLNNFENKVWKKIQKMCDFQEEEQQVFCRIKNKNKQISLHEVIIMASVIEKETGRPLKGVNSKNIDEVNLERRKIAGVFFNRLEMNKSWDSDPTVSYWSNKQVCQQTLKLENCIYLDSPEAKNKYNTYLYSGYPIGPITSPQLDSILAVLYAENNSDLFFVSDASGKKYFGKDETEHRKNIAKVQQINQSLGFNN